MDATWIFNTEQLQRALGEFEKRLAEQHTPEEASSAREAVKTFLTGDEARKLRVERRRSSNQEKAHA